MHLEHAFDVTLTPVGHLVPLLVWALNDDIISGGPVKMAHICCFEFSFALICCVCVCVFMRLCYFIYHFIIQSSTQFNQFIPHTTQYKTSAVLHIALQ